MNNYWPTNGNDAKRHTSSNERKNALQKFVRRYES